MIIVVLLSSFVSLVFAWSLIVDDCCCCCCGYRSLFKHRRQLRTKWKEKKKLLLLWSKLLVCQSTTPTIIVLVLNYGLLNAQSFALDLPSFIQSMACIWVFWNLGISGEERRRRRSGGPKRGRHHLSTAINRFQIRHFIGGLISPT